GGRHIKVGASRVTAHQHAIQYLEGLARYFHLCGVKTNGEYFGIAGVQKMARGRNARVASPLEQNFNLLRLRREARNPRFIECSVVRKSSREQHRLGSKYVTGIPVLPLAFVEIQLYYLFRPSPSSWYTHQPAGKVLNEINHVVIGPGSADIIACWADLRQCGA